MKIVFISIGALIGLTVIGFALCWLRWNVIPTIKDKKLKKKN